MESEIHYLALVCADEILEGRLRARPAWRRSGTAEVLSTMTAFNHWLRSHAEATSPPMSLLDTSHLTLEQSVSWTHTWIQQHWPPESVPEAE
jgi:hypothetical protein